MQHSDRRSFCAIAAGLVAASLAAPVAAQAQALQAVRTAGTIRVAIDLGAPPYGMMDAKMQPTGSDVETAQLLAKDLGVKLNIVPATGPTRVPFLLTDKADIVVASFAITDARRKVVDYSKPYGVVPVVVGAPQGVAIKDVGGLTGKRVAVTRGTMGDALLTELGRKDPGIQIVRYDDDATTNTAITSGQQDYMVVAPSAIAEINRGNPARKIESKFVMTSFPYGIGLKKGSDDLRDWLDAWIAENLANGKLGAIYQKYQGLPLPDSILR